MTKNSSDRYARHRLLSDFGDAGQRRLRDATVLIVGLGGLGCPAIQYLTGCGVGRLILNDYDRLDASNLARQTLYRPDDVGELKANLAASWVHANNPDVTVDLVAKRLVGQEMTAATGAADVVLDCTDNIAARSLIARACQSTKTALVFGAAIAWQGQYAVFRYDQAGPADFSALLSEHDELFEDCQASGVFAPLLGVIGSAMAGEAIKLLIGRGDAGKLLRLFDHRYGWRELALAR